MSSQYSARVPASHEWTTVELPGTASDDTVVIGSLDTFQGGDTADVRIRNVSSASLECFIEEERSSNDETRHVIEDVGLFGTDPGPITDRSGGRIGEAGTVRTNQADADQWHSVSLDGSYRDPVVFMQIMSYDGGDPCHIRLRNVGSGSFEYQIEEWDYLDGSHIEEELGYVVLESGIHHLTGDIPVEVGVMTTTDAWSDVGFSADVGSDPVLITRCQTRNGSQEVVTRNRRVSFDGADVRLQEEEGRDGQHTNESVGYMALPQIVSPYVAQRVASDHRWTPVSFPSVGASDSVVLASIDTYNGRNPADVRLRDVTRRGAEIFVEEEASDDSEMEHKEEAIGLFNVRTGPIFEAGGDRIGEAGLLKADQPGPGEWQCVDLDGSYDDPVVFMQIMSHEGSNPCHVRLRNVESGTFEFQIEEWDYLDGKHNEERLGYLVLETGTHDVAGGGVVEVGTTRGDDDWTGVSFSASVGSSPVLVSRCQTRNGSNEVVTRNRNVTAQGAEIRVQEEQARDDEHHVETIGFLVAPRSRANLTTGVVKATDEWTSLNVTGIPSTDPVVVASVQTFDGANTVGVRMKKTGTNDFELFLEEEKSSDDETAHTREEVAVLATGAGAIHDAVGTVIGEAGIVTSDQPDRGTWHTVDLDHSYSDPVVLMQIMSYEGGSPCHTRLRNVTSDSFDYKIEEWSYLNGKHTGERLGYVVLESGDHLIEGEVPIEAGTATVDHNFKSVSFTTDLRCDPVFLSHCQTHNGGQEVVTRSRDVTRGGARVRLQEEEGRGGQHTEETVGWVAAPKLILGNRRSIDEFRPTCHGFDFGNDFHEMPELPNLPANLDNRIESIDPEYGLCGGMSLAARDFFLNDRPIPTTPDNDPPQSGSLFDYLWRRQIDTFDPGHGWQYLRKFLNFYLPSTFTRARSVSEFRSVKGELDSGRPAVVGLVYVRAGDGNLWDNHQVLAYDYTKSGGKTYISVYDPNYPNQNDIEVRVELKNQGPFDPAPGGKKIDAGHFDGSNKEHNVVGMIHMDVPSQNPPGNL